MLRAGAFVDRYELLCPIGAGGMAEVWVARHRGAHGFEKLFALKAIRPESAGDPTFRAMLLEEARIAAAIVHPHVAQVFDVGDAAGVPFLVMEYVDGDPLGVLARPQGTVPLAIALRIMADACAGLDAAHRSTDRSGAPRAVVHRDVSPENVLVGVQGEVKIIDFGIAHASSRTIDDTSFGSLKGKLHYLSPEQALRAPLGPWTDVFGAGATLFKVLSGRPAFDGGSPAKTIALLMSREAAPRLPATVPAAVADIVARALSPDPGDRFPSAGEMSKALERALSDLDDAPDVGAWVREHLSPATRARRAELARGPSPGSVASAAASTTPLEEQKPPGFLDIRALAAAKANAKANGGADGTARDAEGAGDSTGASGDDEHAVRKPVTPAIVGAGKLSKRRRIPRGVFFAGAAALALGAGAAALLAPGIAKRRAIEQARSMGVELEIGRAAVGVSGVSLHDVVARIPRVPELQEAKIDVIEVVGLSGREIRVRGLDARLSGPLPAATEKLLAVANDARRGLAGSHESPRRYALLSGRFRWSSPFGTGTQIDAGEIGVDVDSRGAGLEEIRASIGRFDVRTKTSVLGPWSFSYERAHDASRARLLLDPPLMDGPSALVVWSRVGDAHLTVRIPRVPLAQLGLRPAELGLPTDASSEAEGTLDGILHADGRIEGRGRLDVYGVRLPTLGGPMDVRVEGATKGDAGRALPLEEARITVGPFVARLDGTLELALERLRLDAAWKTDPIACETIAKREAAKMGPFVSALQDLARRTGAARVTGTAKASGQLRFDSDRPEQPTVTWSTRDSCGVSLFGM